MSVALLSAVQTLWAPRCLDSPSLPSYSTGLLSVNLLEQGDLPEEIWPGVNVSGSGVAVLFLLAACGQRGVLCRRGLTLIQARALLAADEVVLAVLELTVRDLVAPGLLARVPCCCRCWSSSGCCDVAPLFRWESRTIAFDAENCGRDRRRGQDGERVVGGKVTVGS